MCKEDFLQPQSMTDDSEILSGPLSQLTVTNQALAAGNPKCNGDSDVVLMNEEHQLKLSKALQSNTPSRNVFTSLQRWKLQINKKHLSGL